MQRKVLHFCSFIMAHNDENLKTCSSSHFLDDSLAVSGKTISLFPATSLSLISSELKLAVNFLNVFVISHYSVKVEGFF